MKKIYQEAYFDRKAWIFENYEKLQLNAKETLLLLLIEHCREHGILLSYEYLCKKMSVKQKELDSILAKLVSRHFLEISAQSGKLILSTDGLFDFDLTAYEIEENTDIFNTLDIVFGRPLSPGELQKANDLINLYGENAFLDALRIADGQRKHNLAYVEGILRNSEKKQ